MLRGTCAGCNTPVTTNQKRVKAEGKLWHMACRPKAHMSSDGSSVGSANAQLAGLQVHIVGLTNAQKWNGKRGKVLSLDPCTGRYVVAVLTEEEDESETGKGGSGSDRPEITDAQRDNVFVLINDAHLAVRKANGYGDDQHTISGHTISGLMMTRVFLDHRDHPGVSAIIKKAGLEHCRTAHDFHQYRMFWDRYDKNQWDQLIWKINNRGRKKQKQLMLKLENMLVAAETAAPRTAAPTKEAEKKAKDEEEKAQKAKGQRLLEYLRAKYLANSASREALYPNWNASWETMADDDPSSAAEEPATVVAASSKPAPGQDAREEASSASNSNSEPSSVVAATAVDKLITRIKTEIENTKCPRKQQKLQRKLSYLLQ